MKTDPKHAEKTEALKAFVRGGGTIRTLDQIRGMFGYATRSGAKGFLQRLVSEGFLEFRERSYFPTPLMTGLPLFESVRAGLPFTPQQDPVRTVELDRFLIEHPTTTYLVRVKGDSMRDAGIVEGDIAVVDKSVEPRDGDVVIAALGGDVTIKTLELREGSVRLMPANPDYRPLRLSEGDEILGVVTGVVRKYGR